MTDMTEQHHYVRGLRHVSMARDRLTLAMGDDDGHSVTVWLNQAETSQLLAELAWQRPDLIVKALETRLARLIAAAVRKGEPHP